jgi:hypothetical protein
MTIEFLEAIILLGVMFFSGVIGYIIGMRHAWKDAEEVYRSVYGVKK